MKEYEITMQCAVTVDADSEEEAMEKATKLTDDIKAPLGLWQFMMEPDGIACLSDLDDDEDDDD